MADKAKSQQTKKEADLDEKLDEESEESFPASDPPAYMGSAAIVRCPKQHHNGKGRQAAGEAEEACSEESLEEAHKDKSP